MSSASVTDWRSVIFSVGPGNKIRRRLYQEPRNEIIPHDWLKKIAFSFSSSKSTRIVYHLQGWVSLAQTESGQHAQWLRSGWVVIWKKVWVCHINFSGLNLSILPAQKAGGAPDSSSGHASACLLDPQTIDAEIFLFSFDWWYIVFFYISVIITLCSLPAYHLSKVERMCLNSLGSLGAWPDWHPVCWPGSLITAASTCVLSNTKSMLAFFTGPIVLHYELFHCCVIDESQFVSYSRREELLKKVIVFTVVSLLTMRTDIVSQNIDYQKIIQNVAFVQEVSCYPQATVHVCTLFWGLEGGLAVWCWPLPV